MVSVIMPAYNAQKYIGSAIDSILEQTYTDLELLIIEDCSTDDTLKVIESYKDDKARVRLGEREYTFSDEMQEKLLDAAAFYLNSLL